MSVGPKELEILATCFPFESSATETLIETDFMTRLRFPFCLSPKLYRGGDLPGNEITHKEMVLNTVFAIHTMH